MSKKMRVAFYKANKGGLDDKFINRFSGNLGYSHCEIVLDNQHGISAHMQTNGVAIFTYPDLLNSEYWDIYELDIPYSDRAISLAKHFVGAKYDYLGVATKFIGYDIVPNDEKVWCSEYVAIILNIAVVNKLPLGSNTISTREMPNDLFNILKIRFNAKLVSDSNSLQATINSNEVKVDRWGRIINKNPKPNWFWRLFNGR